MGCRADLQINIGFGYGQILEEYTRHIIIIVLAGMYQYLTMMHAQLFTNKRGLNELRTRSNDRDYFQGILLSTQKVFRFF